MTMMCHLVQQTNDLQYKKNLASIRVQRCIKYSDLKYKYEYKYLSFKYKYKYKYLVCTASTH